jgi:hypothetical protein
VLLERNVGESREVNGMKAVIKMLRHLIEFSMAVTLVMIK